MSRLMGELFSGSPLLVLPLVALALFVSAFVAIVVRAYRRTADQYQGEAGLPLGDDEIAVLSQSRGGEA